jgi:hypothetical protein
MEGEMRYEKVKLVFVALEEWSIINCGYLFH